MKRGVFRRTGDFVAGRCTSPGGNCRQMCPSSRSDRRSEPAFQSDAHNRRSRGCDKACCGFSDALATVCECGQDSRRRHRRRFSGCSTRDRVADCRLHTLRIGGEFRFVESVVQNLLLTNVTVNAMRAEEVLKTKRVDLITALSCDAGKPRGGIVFPALKQGSRVIL